METRLYINGAWEDGDTDLPVHNPSTGDIVAKVAATGTAGTNRAIDAAGNAFETWKWMPAIERAKILHRIADLLLERSEEAAALLTRENGKPLFESRGEVAMAADHFRWFAEEGKRACGRLVPPATTGKRHWVVRSPLGVVGAISPWNFPLVLSARKVAPALAAGCSVVLKPSSLTPLTSLFLAQCAEEAGLPPGALNVVNGGAAEISATLLQSNTVRKLSFTGSTRVGKVLVGQSADKLIKLSLELGGNGPLIVFADADIDLAVEEAIKAKFRNRGQSCIAANRIYVEASIAGVFTEKFVKAARILKTGDGFEEGVEIGPLINESSVEAAEQAVRDAIDRGAELLLGGERLKGRDGNFFPPTVLSNVSNESACVKEEVFAPVAPILTFSKEGEVIHRANDSRMGLSAYAFTRDLSRAFRLAEQLEAGTVGINDGVPTASHCPFGGFKESGIGRELGREGLDAFLETKHVSFGI